MIVYHRRAYTSHIIVCHLAHVIPEEEPRHGSKCFLPRRVPYVQPHTVRLIGTWNLQLDIFTNERCSDCQIVVFNKFILGVPEHQAVRYIIFPQNVNYNILKEKERIRVETSREKMGGQIAYNTAHAICTLMHVEGDQ